jgi:hypothetical protein
MIHTNRHNFAGLFDQAVPLVYSPLTHPVQQIGTIRTRSLFTDNVLTVIDTSVIVWSPHSNIPHDGCHIVIIQLGPPDQKSMPTLQSL